MLAQLKEIEIQDAGPYSENEKIDSFTDDKVVCKMYEPMMSPDCHVEDQKTIANIQGINSSCGENENIDVAKKNIDYIRRQSYIKKYIYFCQSLMYLNALSS